MQNSIEGNRKIIVDNNRKIKWHKIRERWDLPEPGLFNPLEPFNHWKLSGHLNTCPNRLNSMGRTITFINQVGSHPRKSLQAQIDEYLGCYEMLYSLKYVNCKVNRKSLLSVKAWKNNITRRHSLLYAHSAMVRVCHIDLINRVYRTHSLRCPAGHGEEWDEMRQDAPSSLQVHQENKINNTLLVNF